MLKIDKRDKGELSKMAEELQLCIESVLYGATDGKLREITTMLKIEDSGKTKRQTINKIREEFRKHLFKKGRR